MTERASEEAPPGLRRARGWAVAALLLWLTTLWLDWWQVRFQDTAGNAYDRRGARPFVPDDVIVQAWGPWLAGGLVALACLTLFVRVAGRSWLYEPPAWQRDLVIAGGLVAVAALSTLFWHTGDPLWDRFWGGTRFTANGTALVGEVVTQPGLGWWLAWSGALCTALGWWDGRRVP